MHKQQKTAGKLGFCSHTFVHFSEEQNGNKQTNFAEIGFASKPGMNR